MYKPGERYQYDFPSEHIPTQICRLSVFFILFAVVFMPWYAALHVFEWLPTYADDDICMSVALVNDSSGATRCPRASTAERVAP